jgi:UrcA family protein
MFAKPRIARFALVAGVALSALTLGAVSSAPIPEMTANADSAWVDVRTGDLDLSNPAGAKAVIGRFQRAAHKVCGPEPSDRLSFGRQYDECVRETVNRAVIDLGAPTVEAMNDQRH